MKNSLENQLIDILRDSELIDRSNPKKPIFTTSSSHKQYLLSLTKDATYNDKAINEDYGNNGVKEEINGKISYQLLASNRRELGFVYYNDISEFLRENGIKEVEYANFFIYEKPKNFFECYSFYVRLDNFLGNISVTNEKDKIIIYYREPIVVKKNIDNLSCKELENIIKHFEFINDDIKQDYQTKIEFFKKAIYDIFKQSIKNEELTIVDIYENFEKVYQEYMLIKQAYIDSLDTDKIKKDFNDKYNETMNFLSTIISSLYTKTLFIPLTVIFALSQKVSSQQTAYENFYIFLALEFFLFLLGYLIYGSKSILNNVKIQIEDLNEETKSFPPLNKKLHYLEAMYNSVNNRFKWILIAVVTTIFALIFIYLPIIEKEFNLFKSFKLFFCSLCQ